MRYGEGGEGEINIEVDPAMTPLAVQAGAPILPPTFPSPTGAIRSIGGLLGPDILFTSTANSVALTIGGTTVNFSLASTTKTDIFDANTEFRQGGTKVVGARDTGWTAGTGVANKGAHAAYAGQTVSAAYVQTEAQTTDDAVKANSRRLKAIEDALRAHGLIN